MYLERFGWLTDDLLAALLKERLSFKDCNAGALFDNFTGTFFENEMVAIKAICDTCSSSTVQLLNIKPTTNQTGLPVCNIIDPEQMEIIEKDLAASTLAKEDKKKKAKAIVDRRIVQLNKKAKEDAIKAKDKKNRNNKDSLDKEVLANSNDDTAPEIVDPTKLEFDVMEVYQMTPEEQAKYLAKTQEIVDYFQGKIPDE